MKLSTYITIGSLSALFFIVQSLPAQWVWSSFGGYLTPVLPARVESVGGSLWNGFAVLRPAPIPLEQTVVAWDLSVAKLLLARVDTHFHTENSKAYLDGQFSAGPAGFSVTGLSGTLDVSLLEGLLQGFGARAAGVVQARDVTLEADSSFKFSKASGAVVWNGGSVAYGFGGAGESWMVPRMEGRLRADNGGAFLAVNESAGGKPLGEAGITGEGLMSLTVLQRVMTVVGMQAGDEDKVLLKTQQPLF